MTAPEETPTARARRLSRRSALWTVLGGAGAIAAAVAGLAAGYLSSAFGRRRERPGIGVGAAEDLDSETFRKYVVSVEHRNAWHRERKAMVVYIKDLYPEDPIALLSACSHLGCSVRWDAGRKRFLCPCHGGVYDEGGRVVTGPPPQPLTRLGVRIEDDVCFVRRPGAAGETA
ncbi:MAG: ubiquinol-cytochrome c reductase iron-sulfur subunit [Planctomycetota bacterium]